MPGDIKKMYKTILADSFPSNMEISFIDKNKRQTLFYEKVLWDIDNVKKGLRYGENPGQEAALYKLINGNLVIGETETISPGRYLASDIELLQSGKHPGKINIMDIDSALNILRYFKDKPTAVIIKHNNPSGAACSYSLEDAYNRAYMADIIAAFGGCIAFNRTVDKATAEAIAAHYAEVVAAPDFEEKALDILSARKNLRIVKIKNIEKLQEFIGKKYVDFRSLMDGGIIAQTSFYSNISGHDDFVMAECQYKSKTYRVKRKPTERELADMLFGWFVECGITSNSVIYVKNLATVGIGTGEQDRVGTAEIARDKAYKKLANRYSYEEFKVRYNELKDIDKKFEIDERVKKEKGGLIGSCMVSDAFFPFRDGIDVGIKEGISSAVQPGGSVNDYEVIEACNEADVAMVYTKQRCFKH